MALRFSLAKQGNLFLQRQAGVMTHGHLKLTEPSTAIYPKLEPLDREWVRCALTAYLRV
jgi:hypothetical protein